MNILKTLENEASARGLQFLIIGGLAINHYGWSRETGDIDFLAKRSDANRWIEWFGQLGYSIYHQSETFLQFTPSTQGSWPVDFMWVNEQTFSTIYKDSIEAPLGVAKGRVPSLDHLFALKLHSLKHARIHRFLKDFQDVVGLIQINKIDAKSQKIRALFEKYGNEDLYGKVLRAIENP